MPTLSVSTTMFVIAQWQRRILFVETTCDRVESCFRGFNRDAGSRADHQAVFRQVLRDAESRGEVQTPGIHQAFRIALLPADKSKRSAVLEVEVAVAR